MAISQALCTSFKQELLTGTHIFGTDTFKLALYVSTANLGANTTSYTTSGEVAAGGAYSTGGVTLTANVSVSGTTAIVDFNDVSWTSSTITARGALIYNNSKSDKAVAVLDFGSDKSSSSGTFTIQFPDATASTAIIRIA